MEGPRDGWQGEKERDKGRKGRQKRKGLREDKERGRGRRETERDDGGEATLLISGSSSMQSTDELQCSYTHTHTHRGTQRNMGNMMSMEHALQKVKS